MHIDALYGGLEGHTRQCSMALLDLPGYNFGVILIAWASKVLLKSTKIAKVLITYICKVIFLAKKYNFADPLKPGSLEYHVGGLHYSPQKSTFLCASRWNKVQKPLAIAVLGGQCGCLASNLATPSLWLPWEVVLKDRQEKEERRYGQWCQLVNANRVEGQYNLVI